METIAKYAYEVYKKGSFTKASKNLFISQPSLSAAISKLENDLGFRIFDRSTVPCSLTPQGKIYIESIEEIIEIENNMHRRIKKFSNDYNRSLAVGGSSFASYLILTKICSEFFKSYPEINVTLDIGNIGNSLSLMEKIESKYEQEELKALIEKHVAYTGSKKGKEVLEKFQEYLPKFKKIIPEDYKEMLQLSAQFEEQGMTKEEAQIEAFYKSVGSK